ncbi:hypothetical protein KSP40_PGU018805 [Platanthera guangdongensis]|uniref:PNPLA domain-containing protein n=1 Tax=Platanthera guangdongensis TaxID=2320717 RepID=A0ABR2MMC5_9ASPA
MEATPTLIEPCFDVDKLSYEIFAILESKFLFGYDDPKLFLLLTAAYLACMESSLRSQSGDPTARIADFFDVVAGSGSGGVVAAMLFARGEDGRPRFSAEEAVGVLAKNGAFRRIFGEATLRDTVKPVLIPCFDLSSGAPFLFSRADAVETDGYDFRIREICDATCAIGKAVELNSIDGRTRIAAVGGRVAMANPTAAAITHVLHNKQEFPFAAGIDDLLVVSIAGADPAPQSSPSTAVDQAIALAFSHNQATVCNYVRLQVHGLCVDATKASINTSIGDAKKTVEAAEELLRQRNIESVLFQGKRLSNETNLQKLQRITAELIKEGDERKKSPTPTVFVKQVILTPRTSATTTITDTTASSSPPTPSAHIC